MLIYDSNEAGRTIPGSVSLIIGYWVAIWINQPLGIGQANEQVFGGSTAVPSSRDPPVDTDTRLLPVEGQSSACAHFAIELVLEDRTLALTSKSTILSPSKR